MIGDELGSGIIEGATLRPIGREARQQILIDRFEEQSREAAEGEVPFGYDNLEDWFETACATFKAAKLPIPERPGFMRADDWDLEGLVGLADQLGRKLEADDVTPGMRKFATEWLRKQETVSLSFLLDMQRIVDSKTGKLSLGQAKGVLNCAIADARRRPKAAPKGQAEPVELEAAIYFKDGEVYKVQKAVHGSGHAYAKKLVQDDAFARGWGFIYAKGAIRDLTPEHRMTLDQAKEFGAIYGVCCNCGATLTNEESIELGIGPICRGKFA
jgi:hypothetical protein